MVAHRPVMLSEVIAGLITTPSGVYVDGTFGRGGHARAILEKLDEHGRLYAFDKDPEAVAEGLNDPRFSLYHASFANIAAVAPELVGRIDGILLDLGVSSPQLDTPERGFSFLRDGPLDMRMDPTQGVPASTWLATVEVTALMRVLREYGEEQHAPRIAHAIVRVREETPIMTTLQLARIVAAASPSHDRHKHPATRTFQAIRIFINEELKEIENFLSTCLSLLAVGGRLAVLSFHSLEDRLIKRFMAKAAKGDDFPAGFPVRESQLHKRMVCLGRAMKASTEEVSSNARARSAVLRIAEKIT